MATTPTSASETRRDRTEEIYRAFKEEFYQAFKTGEVGAVRACLEAVDVVDGGGGVTRSPSWNLDNSPSWNLVNSLLGRDCRHTPMTAAVYLHSQPNAV